MLPHGNTTLSTDNVRRDYLSGKGLLSGAESLAQRLFTGLLMLSVLLSQVFWDRKVKIAILTLATFAALC